MHPAPPQPRFSLTRPWLAVLGGLLATLLFWSRASADPDFYLPDPFPAFMGWLVAVFAGSGFVRSPVVRANLRVVLAVIPAVAVLGLEVYAWRRDAGEQGERIEQVADPLLRYRYRPGARGLNGEPPINSAGLRDVEHAEAKPPGTWRVVVLGDSVPNDPSVPFERRFHRVLQKGLAAAAPPGLTVEVINVSCEGYDTQQEVRLFETVGLRYRPDLVVVAYVLNDAFIQNGGYRRIGNSFFLFQALPRLHRAVGASDCRLYRPLYDAWAFNLAVTAPLRHLRTLSELHHFPVVVAALPLVTAFDDPVCAGLYDLVGALANEQGFPYLRVADAFRGEDFHRYLKPGAPFDNTHPNAGGHEKIGAALVEALKPSLPRAL